MELWIVWLIVATLLLVVELITGFIAALCLAVGALVASVCGIFGFGIEVQLIALVVGVILAFIFLAPFVNRLRKRRSGRVRIDGDSWQIKSKDGDVIRHGTKVKVVGYDSIILIVKPV